MDEKGKNVQGKKESRSCFHFRCYFSHRIENRYRFSHREPGHTLRGTSLRFRSYRCNNHLFLVRVSVSPADEDHHYGHGKVENFSALIETLLLLVTCSWIIYEAIQRLSTGKLHIDVTYWSYIVVVTSIIVDYTRSRALMKAAKKHNSQALEADAIHFSTDIWSSAVVLFGLICTIFGLYSADAIAAIIVAGIVMYISYQLGRRSINVLLDKAPTIYVRTIEEIMNEIPQVFAFHDVKIRNSGADIFVEISIHVDPSLNIEKAHRIAQQVEERINARIARCSVHVHQEPEVKPEIKD